MTLALQDTHDADKLAALLCDLLEPSRPLREILVPAVLLRLTASKQVTASQLIDLCEQVATGWTYDQKADFIAGHPLIGEVKNLSAHSEKEQANSVPTPPIVLERLVHLNAVYCTVFPGLRFITFVNGRSRAEIINEMEKTVGLELSPNPLPEDFPACDPPTLSEQVLALRRDPDSDAWKNECERCLADVWKIARARAQAMGLE